MFTISIDVELFVMSAKITMMGLQCPKNFVKPCFVFYFFQYKVEIDSADIVRYYLGAKSLITFLYFSSFLFSNF